MRQTKIIATVGPASSEEAVIGAMIEAGVSVFRLNFSHGTHETHRGVLDTIRRTAGRLEREIGVMQDLSGPKIRTGALERGEQLLLSPGDPFEIRIGTDVGRPGMVSTTYAPLAEAVNVGDRLLLDDGRIELRVDAISSGRLETRVLDGGLLGEHKGISAPNVPLPAAGLLAKDEADLRFGLAAGVDLVALSFVQSAEDIHRARAIATDAGRPDVPLVAKLERPEAMRRLADIIAAADAVMVARGDLGLEMPLEQVPQVQKRVLRDARASGVPVIVATQVLESMRAEWRPTRAEVSDAAGAVDAGADAIMLSGETAVGSHPPRAVHVLDAIIRAAESVPPPWSLPLPSGERPDHLPPLCDAAVTLAARGPVDAIIALTREGRTARLLSARRPSVPVYAVTDDQAVARRLCLWWGVAPVIHSLQGDPDSCLPQIAAQLRVKGVLPSPATVVMVSTNPDLQRSTANFVRIRKI